MSLRTKCAILLIAFELTVAATLMFTVRYIGAYFDDAANTLAVSGRAGVDLARLRTLIRNELSSLKRAENAETLRAECERIEKEINSVVELLRQDLSPALESTQLRPLVNLLESRRPTVAARLAEIDRGVEQPARVDPEQHLAIDDFISRMESGVNAKLRKTIEASFAAQDQAALILSVNMVVAAALGILGMFLMRKWVLLPVQELKAATDEFGKGRLEYRARVHTGDELGQLGDALNRMSADLSRIEKQMVLRERAAAMGDLISYIAHNIRNPLAGIRSLVDSCQRETEPDSPLSPKQGEIIAAIERLQRWLRELEHTCKPLEISLQPVGIRQIVDNIVAVFKPMADRRSVALNQRLNGEIGSVMLDERHFEQAVAAIVGNAIEAVGENGAVTIGVESNGDPSHWSLYVEDTGRGIPDDLSRKIFDPTFTTKRDGRGLGLAMARKVAELHGGRLTLESPDGGGARFRFVMPVAPVAG